MYQIFVLLLVAVFCVGSSCLLKPRDGIYLLPEGFTGGVIILFDQPDGNNRSVENGRYVYEIPLGGVLKVSDIPSTGLVDMEYFFVGKTGDRKQIQYLHVTGETSIQGLPQNKFGNISDSDHANRVFVMNSGGVGSFNTSARRIQFTSFVVSTPKNSDQAHSKLQDRISEIQETFAR